MKPFWTPIDPDNLPEGEVLAACFDPESISYKMKKYGTLYYGSGLFRGDNSTGINCTRDYNAIYNCTHYHDIDKYDKEIT